MSRISEDELSRLKSEVSLSRLAEARGIRLKKSGDNLLGLCPFHDDREPSLVISASKNVWHCLGACQAGGSVIDWVMRAEKCSFRLAVEMLRKEHPSLVATPSSDAAANTPKLGPKLEAIAEAEEPDGAVLRRVSDYYHATLKESAEALAYLASRGLESAEMMSHFQLGYANRTLGYRLPSKKLQAGAALRGQLQRLGLVRESGHEHFTGSITVPLFDAAGAVAGMYGRKIRRDLRPGTPLHLYLPGPHRGVFNRAALAADTDIILCESLIDALTFWCTGFRNVTSAYGVEGFTNELREALVAGGVRKVLIAYDRDDAGEKATAKLAPELSAMGLEVFRVLFPKGMDANEYALSVKPAARGLDAAIRASSWLAGSRPVMVGHGDGSRETGARHDAGLPGADRVAASDGLDPGGVLAGEEASDGGALRAGGSTASLGRERGGEHRGGAGEAEQQGLCEAPVDRARQLGGGRHTDSSGREAG